jgi:hypothetical protein
VHVTRRKGDPRRFRPPRSRRPLCRTSYWGCLNGGGERTLCLSSAEGWALWVAGRWRALPTEQREIAPVQRTPNGRSCAVWSSSWGPYATNARPTGGGRRRRTGALGNEEGESGLPPAAVEGPVLEAYAVRRAL